MGRYYLTFSGEFKKVTVVSQSFNSRSMLEQYLGHLRETMAVASLSINGSLPRLTISNVQEQWYFELRDYDDEIILTSIPFSDDGQCNEALKEFKHQVGHARITDYV